MLLAKLGMLEYLSSGITANFDMYLDNDCHAAASKELGFRTVLCGSMNDFGGTVEETEEEFYRLNELCHARLGFMRSTRRTVRRLSGLRIWLTV